MRKAQLPTVVRIGGIRGGKLLSNSQRLLEMFERCSRISLVLESAAQPVEACRQVDSYFRIRRVCPNQSLAERNGPGVGRDCSIDGGERPRKIPLMGGLSPDICLV